MTVNTAVVPGALPEKRDQQIDALSHQRDRLRKCIIRLRKGADDAATDQWIKTIIANSLLPGDLNEK